MSKKTTTPDLQLNTLSTTTVVPGVKTKGENTPIRVLIVDDQPILHIGINSILQNFQEIEVVGEAYSREEALNLCPQVLPDIILIDLIIPDKIGISVIGEITREHPEIKIIVITSDADPEIIQSAFDAGAIGYLLKALSVSDLIESIKSAFKGLPVLSLEVIQSILQSKTEAKNSSTQHLELVTTKLHRPRLSQKILHRHRLYEHLEEYVDYPLTVVSAPVGYGKSTLVSAWLESESQAHAWLTLDESDNDFEKFNSYFLASLQKVVPEFRRHSKWANDKDAPPNAQLLANKLINDLDPLGTDFIMVLDDYNVIDNPEVHEFLSTLLQHPPQGMHLFIVSRHEPDLSISKLRVRNQVNEISVLDMQFTVEETTTLIQERLNVEVTPSVAAHLSQRAEGWIAVLNSIAFSSGNGEVLELVSVDQELMSNMALDFLMTEIFADQPKDIQNLMLKTSILDDFNASIHDAISSPKIGGQSALIRGEDYINWLIAKNIFVVPLDDEGKLFRFHGLFRQLLHRKLRKQYDSDEISIFHTRASNWYAENGQIENALRHAQSAGNVDVAAEVVANYRHELTHQGHWQQLEEMLHNFPSSIIESHPELTMAKVSVLYQDFQMAEIPALLDREEFLLSENGLDHSTAIQLQGELDAYRSLLCYWKADADGTVANAQAALENLPGDWFTPRALALQHLAAGYQMQGDIEHAQTMRGEPLDHAHMDSTPPYYSHLLAGSCMRQWVSANLPDLRYTSSHSLVFAENHALSESLASANYFMGVASYEENNLEGAHQYFDNLYEQRYEGKLHLIAHGLLGLSTTYQAMGEPEKALHTIDNVTEFLLEKHNRDLLEITEAFRAELDLRQGNLAAAKLWTEKFVPKGSQPMSVFYHPDITYIKVLLAINTESNMAKAEKLINRLKKHLKLIHNKRFLIEVFCLEALMHDAQQKNKEALASMEQAILLAEPGGLLRVFLDYGPKVAHLLALLDQQGVSQGYVQELLKAFVEEKPNSIGGANQALIDPLTARELQILGLLAKRKTNKEIAADFVISPGTVKTHTIKIYQKLEVNGRREAVEKGEALGLIATATR